MHKRFAFAFALFLLPLAAQAQEKIPTADEVLDRYVEVTGGKAAYEKLKNRVATGSVEVKGAGLGGSISIKEAPDAKNVTIFELKGAGKMEMGTDGTVAWQRSDIAGGKLLTGDEKAHAIRNAFFNNELNWKKVFTSAKCVGSKRMEDKECWQLEMTTPEGLVFQKFFDKKGGLLICAKVTIKTPQMEVPTETFPADYQKVDGILYPHEMRTRAMQLDMVVRVDKITHNADLPADAFAPPADIKKLMEKKDKEKDK